MTPAIRRSVLSCAVLALWALPAAAQVPVFNTSNQPYVALTGGTTLSFSSTDDSGTVVGRVVSPPMPRVVKDQP